MMTETEKMKFYEDVFVLFGDTWTNIDTLQGRMYLSDLDPNIADIYSKRLFAAKEILETVRHDYVSQFEKIL